jgi:flavin-dependent dehydrogenase
VSEHLPVSATIDAQEASNRRWDIAIAGAGVAGASLAIQLARRGLTVLLVEAQRFPREKVCGGCLNQRAIAALDQLGVLPTCQAAGGVELNALCIRQAGRDHRWMIPPMLSLRRSTLDTILVQAAIASGAAYLDQTSASLGPQADDDKQVTMQLKSAEDAAKTSTSNGKQTVTIRSQVAVAATGLTRSVLAERDEWPAEVTKGSRIGVQALISTEELARESWCWDRLLQLRAGNELRMLVGTNGYLGISQTDGGYYDFAAALDPEAVRRHGSVSEAIDELLISCRLPALGGISPQRWASTPHLTRRSWPVAKKRVFLLGDSIGYIEPFTGEGMSWALAGAKRLSDLLASQFSSSRSEPDSAPSMRQVEAAWNAWAAGQRGQRQAVCRWVAGQVRHPRRTAWLLRGLDWFPPVRNMILRKATR